MNSARNLIFGKKYGNPILQGLISFYRFENNLLDSHSSNHGMVSSGSITYTSAKLGNGINFTSSGQGVSIPLDSRFTFTNGTNTDFPFSVNIWFKNTTFSGIDTALFFAGNNSYFVYLNNNKIRFLISANSGVTIYKLVEINTTLTANTFYNVCCTYDGSKTTAGMKIYINGTLTAVTATNVGTYNSMLGGNHGLAINGTNNGRVMDDTGIWNRELTPAEITELYNSGLGKVYPF